MFYGDMVMIYAVTISSRHLEAITGYGSEACVLLLRQSNYPK